MTNGTKLDSDKKKEISLDERLGTKAICLVIRNTPEQEGFSQGVYNQYYQLLLSDKLKDVQAECRKKRKHEWEVTSLGSIEVPLRIYEQTIRYGMRLDQWQFRDLEFEVAKHYAKTLHKGQCITGTNEPVMKHLERVVTNIEKSECHVKRAEFEYDIGKNTQRPIICFHELQIIGWLHDTLKDTGLTYRKLKSAFGEYVAYAVDILTENVDRAEYKTRSVRADKGIKLVKLCDVADVTRTLHCLPKGVADRLVEDCRTFYIPLAEKMCQSELISTGPGVVTEIQTNIINYLTSK